jgi:hypothetical protein
LCSDRGDHGSNGLLLIERRNYGKHTGPHRTLTLVEPPCATSLASDVGHRPQPERTHRGTRPDRGHHARVQ